uniref:Uncharacterized protein n=1 Tax=Triticum urartu TaxID=4572 RepID=A0A8R7TMM9_TRIUA
MYVLTQITRRSNQSFEAPAEGTSAQGKATSSAERMTALGTVAAPTSAALHGVRRPTA